MLYRIIFCRRSVCINEKERNTIKPNKAINPIFNPGFDFSISQKLIPAANTINKTACTMFISNPSNSEKGRDSILSIYEFIDQMSNASNLPTSIATAGTNETAQSDISPSTIKLDNGTAKKLVSIK